ncbi:MAG TPA: Hpt domain-containing protein [Rhodospirillales bacterium]|jgi:chemotaxis protein histidine kinase CheA|nr:Hpt domain-containing protein [Rhodospirillales bacterium]HJO69693.1 Hpt domain-containing protein [Rhodospirillales bacterium]
MAESETPRIITPPNTLKSKVGVGGPKAVDPAVLKRAEEAIANLGDDYLDWVQEDIKKLEDGLSALKAAKGGGRDLLDTIFRVAHEIKGQGGSFGYNLMTLIGDQLCRFVEDMAEAGPPEVEVIGLHVDALKIVIANRMQGDGGQAGQALLRGLEKVVAKIG